MNDSESSVEEITHLENHLNDTILKILDEDQLSSAEEKKKRSSLLSQENVNDFYHTSHILKEQDEFELYRKPKTPIKSIVRIDSGIQQQQFYSPVRQRPNYSNSFLAIRQGNLSVPMQPTPHFSHPLGNYVHSNFTYNPYTASSADNFQHNFPVQSNLSSKGHRGNKQTSASSNTKEFQNLSCSTNDSKTQIPFLNSSFISNNIHNNMPYKHSTSGYFMPSYPYNINIPQSNYSIRVPSCGSKSGSYSGFPYNPQMTNHESLPLNSSSQWSSKSFQASQINYDLMSPNEIICLIPVLCKEQLGCRFLQSKIESIPYYAEQYILPYINHILLEVINDQFGNYLIQKILQITGSETSSTIFAIVSVCLNITTRL